ncbi:hypothetical protein B0H17DRAFT_1173605 [Mycena rosella]|uniref:DUF6924 domain-containing protein n=1 Tax=Mycena rosella TaxID=1033263 RepID=A0AAD7H2F5_MYCRO|nr:hypothetical protein B0H17DRAFT_1173605 [Mycena rosella]
MWAVFVTAPEASVKDVQALLESLHDALGVLDLSSGPAKGEFAVLTSKNLASIVPPDLGVLPLRTDELSANHFAKASLEEINKFVREKEKMLKETLELSTHHWVVMDRECLEGSKQSCIVCEQKFEFNEDKPSGGENSEDGYTNEFRAARIDQEDVLSMLNNLDIANMDWEDWADDEGIVDDYEV